MKKILFLMAICLSTTLFATAQSEKISDEERKLLYLKHEEFLGEETVKEGSRLAQIARRWYGEQAFWVYIYEANSFQIKDPAKLKAGMIVRIPKMDLDLVDPKNQESIDKANALKAKYLR